MKKILFSVLFVFSVSLSFSQSFMHGAGIGIFVTKAPAGDATFASSLSYSPRVNFVETDMMSVSLGIPINIGFSGSYYAEYNSRYGGYEENSLGAFINAPAMVNLNFGAGSAPENESRAGFFIGGGYGLHFGDFGETVFDDYYGDYYYTNKYGTAFGPAANVGARIGVGNNYKNIEIKASYMKTTGEKKMDIYGVNVYFNF